MGFYIYIVTNLHHYVLSGCYNNAVLSPNKQESVIVKVIYQQTLQHLDTQRVPQARYRIH